MYFKKNLVKGSIIVVLPNKKILYAGKKLLKTNARKVLWDAESLINHYYPNLKERTINSIVKNSSVYKFTGSKVKLIKKASNPRLSLIAQYIIHQPLKKIKIFG